MARQTTNVSIIVSEIGNKRVICLIKIIAAIGKAIMGKWIELIIHLVKEITTNPLRLVPEINMRIAA
jgi:hypothetical protein